MSKHQDYYRRHREERLVYQREHYLAHGEEERSYERQRRQLPRTKALNFFRRNPDCTSSFEAVCEIYAASVNMLDGSTGRVGRGPDDLVLDHIHDGPAIGLIPRWLNIMCERLDGRAGQVITYLDKRRQEA